MEEYIKKCSYILKLLTIQLLKGANFFFLLKVFLKLLYVCTINLDINYAKITNKGLDQVVSSLF